MPHRCLNLIIVGEILYTDELKGLGHQPLVLVSVAAPKVDLSTSMLIGHYEVLINKFFAKHHRSKERKLPRTQPSKLVKTIYILINNNEYACKTFVCYLRAKYKKQNCRAWSTTRLGRFPFTFCRFMAFFFAMVVLVLVVVMMFMFAL